MANEGSSPAPVIHYVSKSTVRPSSTPLEPRRGIHLTIWDIRLLSMQYIQKGILLPIHATATANFVIRRLISSLSLALDHFYPLGGRFSTTHHATSPPSLSVSLDCNDEGVEFTHATASHLTASDLLSPPTIPPILHSLFPLNKALGIHGHSTPLLAVQATELADGTLFLACSLNHAVADGTSFWNFLNFWSAISRSATSSINSLTFERWFPPSSPPPIMLPFSNLESRIKKHTPPEFSESMFYFSSSSVRNLKSVANKWVELCGGVGTISSLQAVLAHVWICIVRARKLPADQQTRCIVTVGCRARLEPPLLEGYFGNCITSAMARASVGELLIHGLGWTASRINEVVGEQTDSVVRKWVDSRVQEPELSSFDGLKKSDILIGGSPRFDVYGNDFGWGRPVAARGGGENKIDGKVTMFPGPEDGSMALEVCLLPWVTSSLMEDQEFIDSQQCKTGSLDRVRLCA